jgi:hypothetical protein
MPRAANTSETVHHRSRNDHRNGGIANNSVRRISGKKE